MLDIHAYTCSTSGVVLELTCTDNLHTVVVTKLQCVHNDFHKQVLGYSYITGLLN